MHFNVSAALHNLNKTLFSIVLNMFICAFIFFHMYRNDPFKMFLREISLKKKKHCTAYYILFDLAGNRYLHNCVTTTRSHYFTTSLL
jgi:hypothetical protein